MSDLPAKIPESDPSKSPDQEKRSDESGSSVATPVGKLPMPPWWILLLSLLLIPALIIGGMLWGAGWAIAQRWAGSNMPPPRDATFLMKAGGLCARAILLPSLFYFAQTSQVRYSMLRGAIWAGGKSVKTIGKGATTMIRKAISAQDEPKKGE